MTEDWCDDSPPRSRVRRPRSAQHMTAGPYEGVLVVEPGPIVVISGQGPLNIKGEVVGRTIRDQTRTTLNNCEVQLQSARASLESVFKVNAYLADLDDWEDFNVAYAEIMPIELPVRTTVGARLLLGMRLEIEMWAAPLLE